MLGLAGAVHEYFKLSSLSTGRQARKIARILDMVFHIAVLTAVAIYAVGASQSFKQPPPPNAHTLYEAGVMLLLVLFLSLTAVFGFIGWRTKGTNTAAPLFWGIAISLVLTGIRIIYATVSAFNQGEPALNPVTGAIVLQAVFVLVPGALIIAAMVIGGTMTTHLEVYDSFPTTAGSTGHRKRASDSSNV